MRARRIGVVAVTRRPDARGERRVPSPNGSSGVRRLLADLLPLSRRKWDGTHLAGHRVRRLARRRLRYRCLDGRRRLLGSRKLRTLVPAPTASGDGDTRTPPRRATCASLACTDDRSRRARRASVTARGVRIPRLRVFLVNGMRAAARYAKRTYSVETELVFVALVLLAWHAIRIPIEGDVATSLAHADDVLGFERALSLNVEHAVIGRLDDAMHHACSRVALHEHPPAGAVRLHRRRAPARARALPGRPHDVRAGVPARGARHLALSACPSALASRVRLRRAADRRRADEHDRRSLPQHDGCGGEPALRVRGSRRRDRDLALPAVAAGICDARLSGRGLPRHRRHRKPLRASTASSGR